MSELRDILAAFLADIERAQDSANRLSTRIAERYRLDPLLRNFPVPNALLDDVEAELHFVVVDPQQSASSAGSEAVAPQVDGHALVEPAMEAASAALVAVASGLAARADSSAPLESLRALQSQENRQSLATRIAPLLALSLQRRVVAELAQEARPRAAEEAASTVEPLVVSAPALAAELHGFLAASATLSAQGGADMSIIEPAAGRAAALAAKRLSAIADALLADARSQARPPPGLAVDFATERVSQYPQYSLLSLKIHARLRNYKWVIVDQAEGRAELLPTD